MIFISILTISTIAIAGAAAFFSVFGLANTFTGVFWSVVIMGSALEAGKLVAASYLYRYWDKTSLLLKTYLMSGVAVLMVMTSTGIFGYLSSGYQQDVLPLQQLNSQVELLEEEKARKLERKKQIDDLMAKAPVVSSVQRGEQLDPNAARVLRETTRSRESLNRQYKEEQKEITIRLNSLDKEILELKQKQIEKEAHVGPIIYIAKAFGLSTDDATKYLIFLIIFAFDPMAVALTLALNIALKERENEATKDKPSNVQPVEQQPEQPLQDFVSTIKPLEPEFSKIINDNLDDLYVSDPPKEEVKEQPVVEEKFEMEKRNTQELPPLDFPKKQQPPRSPQKRWIEQPQPILQNRNRLLARLDVENQPLQEILDYYRELKQKLNSSGLSGEEKNLLITIENFLKKKGLDIYIKD